MATNSFVVESTATPMPTGTRGVVGCSFNGDLSFMEINAATVTSVAVTTTGLTTPAMAGLTLGAGGDQLTPGNFETQEVVLFNTAHSSAQAKADNAAMRAAWRF
jgi:hypothetical protein